MDIKVEKFKTDQGIKDAIARAHGFADEAALHAADEAERAKMHPDVRKALDDVARDHERAFLFGSGSPSSQG